MKRRLLPEKGNDYKANLHLHATLSDGASLGAPRIAPPANADGE